MNPYEEIDQRPLPSNALKAYRNAGVTKVRWPGQVPHTVADDSRLNAPALAMLVLRIAHERGRYALNVHRFKKLFGTGKGLFHSTLNSLKEIGYISRGQDRLNSSRGQWSYALEQLRMEAMPPSTRDGYLFWAESHFEILCRKDLNLKMVGVYVYCASHAPTFEITSRLLVRRFGWSTETARNYLKFLEKRQLLQAGARKRERDGRFKGSFYTVVRLPGQTKPDTASRATEERAAAKGATHKIISSTVNDTTRKNSLTETTRFEETRLPDLSLKEFDYFEFSFPDYWEFHYMPSEDELFESVGLLGPDNKILRDLDEATGQRFFRPIQTRETCTIFRGMAIVLTLQDDICLRNAYEWLIGFVIRRVGSQSSAWLNSPKLITDGLRYQMDGIDLAQSWKDIIAADQQGLLDQCRRKHGDNGYFRLIGESGDYHYRLLELVGSKPAPNMLRLQNWSDVRLSLDTVGDDNH